MDGEPNTNVLLARWQGGTPVVRIVDFESSYEVSRHSTGAFYDPPTTPGFSAPEAPNRTSFIV